MTSLIIAHVSFWIMLAGLAAVLYVLSRQIGGLHHRLAPAGALSVNALLVIGQRAPELAVRSLAGTEIRVGSIGRPQLLMFVAPDCPISRSLVPVLRPLARSEGWLDLVLVSDGGTPETHAQFAGQPALDGLDYVLSEELGRACGVSKLPYAVLVDEAGRVAGFGIVNSREHLESLMEAKERGIPSIQAFMASSDQFYRADGS